MHTAFTLLLTIYPMGVYRCAMEKITSCCASGRKKEREDIEKRNMLNRLNRVEGQIRGIRRMVEENAYCPDILVQVSAAIAALKAFNRVLLTDHLHSCVVEDIRAGKDDVIDELTQTLQKLMA